MLLVKTRVAPSSIHRLGIFADQRIQRGQVIWKFDPRCDVVWSAQTFRRLPQVVREHIIHYGYQNTRTKSYVLSLDNSVFFNHSDHPNTTEIPDPDSPEGLTIAARDIRKGEELTADYYSYDGATGKKLNEKIRL